MYEGIKAASGPIPLSPLIMQTLQGSRLMIAAITHQDKPKNSRVHSPGKDLTTCDCAHAQHIAAARRACHGQKGQRSLRVGKPELMKQRLG